MKLQTATTQEQGSYQDVALTFVWEENQWRIIKSGSQEARPPRVNKQSDTVSWRLPERDLSYVVLQLNPDYFSHVNGAPMDSEDGIIILAKPRAGNRDFTKLRVIADAIPSPPEGDEYLYVYTALCMNGDGEVEDVERVLEKGDVAGWLAHKNLTFATGRSMSLAARVSPPSMIIM